MIIYWGAKKVEDAIVRQLPASCMHNMLFLSSLLVLRKDNKTRGIRLSVFAEDSKFDGFHIEFV